MIIAREKFSNSFYYDDSFPLASEDRGSGDSNDGSISGNPDSTDLPPLSVEE